MKKLYQQLEKIEAALPLWAKLIILAILFSALGWVVYLNITL